MDHILQTTHHALYGPVPREDVEAIVDTSPRTVLLTQRPSDSLFAVAYMTVFGASTYACRGLSRGKMAGFLIANLFMARVWANAFTFTPL